ncbi:hypothetical protein [Colidextribacter sp. OB.20]|uniref:hypothetical protein n=1 Tax=Colidextribacter sp. OB.20 TaxID=2304568 RepID=UPI00191C45DB|nr:hypothetical protein [Colidextribacter sp. OB.20]
MESDIYSAVSAALKAEFPGIWTSGEDADLPARFPAVTIVEQDNAVKKDMRTLNIENAVGVMYEVNVYSNKVGYRKSEAKKIMATADREMTRLGFTRTMMNPISNLQDASIYRIVARYEADVDKDLWIYQS